MKLHRHAANELHLALNIITIIEVECDWKRRYISKIHSLMLLMARSDETQSKSAEQGTVTIKQKW